MQKLIRQFYVYKKICTKKPFLFEVSLLYTDSFRFSQNIISPNPLAFNFESCGDTLYTIYMVDFTQGGGHAAILLAKVPNLTISLSGRVFKRQNCKGCYSPIFNNSSVFLNEC